MWNSDEKDKTSSFWSGCSEFALSVGCNEFALGVVMIILFYKIKSESGACRWGVCVCSNSSGVKY